MIYYIFPDEENPELFNLEIFTENAEFIADASFNHIGDKIVVDGTLARSGYGTLLYNTLAMYAYHVNSYLCNSLGGLQEQALSHYERMFEDSNFITKKLTFEDICEYTSNHDEYFLNDLYEDKCLQCILTGYQLKPDPEFLSSIKLQLTIDENKTYENMIVNLEKALLPIDQNKKSLFLYCYNEGTQIIDKLHPLKKV